MRRGLLAVSLNLAMLAQPASAQQRAPADDRFLESLRRELIDKLQATGTFSTFASPDRATIKAKTLDGREVDISLDNLSGEVRARPQQRGDLVARFVRTVTAAAAPPKESAPPNKAAFLASLRPVLRATDYVLHARKAANDDPLRAVLTWPFAGEASILIAVDGSEQVRMVTGDDVKTHGVEKDALLGVAKDNVRALLASLKLERSPPFVALSLAEDYYTGAMLLLPEAVVQLEAELGPDFLVVLPDRNSAVAARTRDVAQLKRFAAAIAQQRKAEALLPHFLQRLDGAWRPYPAR